MVPRDASNRVLARNPYPDTALAPDVNGRWLSIGGMCRGGCNQRWS
jgi:hypothetical protein